MEKTIEIPEGYAARIEGNKVILEPNDENIRSFLYEFIKVCGWSEKQFPPREMVLAYLEKQKEQKLTPKFKVGDRIYDKRDSYNRNVIRKVRPGYYINAFAQKMDMAYTDANFEFLEHLDNDSTPNKPAEWSEEE